MAGVKEINLHRIQPLSPQTFKKPSSVSGAPSFKELLNSFEGVKFSAHAQQRIVERGIELDTNSLNALNQAVQKAREKGATNALILMDDKAFIANVRNSTVITAADRESLKENVFTNIDSAVVV